MKILVVAPSWIGDTILAQPLFTRLHEQHPSLSLDVFAPSWVAPVLSRMAEVRRVIPNPFAHGQLKLGERWKTGRALKQEAYDAAIVLPNSWKSALLPLFAGIPIRIGYLGEARYGLLNRAHPLDENAVPLLVERYAQLASPKDFGLTASPEKNEQKKLAEPHLSPNENAIRSTLTALNLSKESAPIVFCPGAEYGPAKRWPAEHFAELARALSQEGHPIWLVGSNKDQTICNEIIALAKLEASACLNLSGKTNLAQAIDLLSCARLVVSNDSGLMHVAAALKRPLVALYGSSTPRYTPPISSQAEIIWLELKCSPCFKRECPLGPADYFRCMKDLSPAQVLSTAHRILKES